MLSPSPPKVHTNVALEEYRPASFWYGLINFPADFMVTPFYLVIVTNFSADFMGTPFLAFERAFEGVITGYPFLARDE